MNQQVLHEQPEVIDTRSEPPVFTASGSRAEFAAHANNPRCLRSLSTPQPYVITMSRAVYRALCRP